MTCQRALNDGASAWAIYTRTPHGRLREDLILSHLSAHLPTHRTLCVLDAGAGAGGYSFALARRGYSVTLLDSAPAMLAEAQSLFSRSDGPSFGRAEFVSASVSNLPADLLERRFDVILVHALLEYLLDPLVALGSLVSLLARRGLLSLVLVNPYAEVHRLGGPRHDPVGALRALHGDLPPESLFGASRRMVSPDDCETLLAGHGLEIVSRCGVRLFAESYTPEELSDEATYTALLSLEREAGLCEPFWRFGRYLHFIWRYV